MATEVTVIVDPDGGAGYDYTSLAAAIAGEARNLVTADEQLTIKCRCTGGTADGPATVSGFTTDATRYVKIWTDPTEDYRHSGKIESGNKYRMSFANSSGLTITCDYCHVDGLQFIKTSGSSHYQHAIVISDNIYSKISNIVAKLSGNNSYSERGISIVTDAQLVRIVSCIFYNGSAYSNSYCAAVLASGTQVSVYAYNTTVFGWHSGFSRVDIGSFYAYNCIAANISSFSGDFVGFTGIDHCASDDGDGTNAVNISPGATEADDWAACFNDYANGDFSLKSGSVCIGAGVDDPGSGLYSDDILGNARTSPWDIGAFEYVSAAPPSFKAAWAINSNRVIQ